MNRLELIEKINALKLRQIEYFEDIEYPQEIQDEFDKCEIVASELEVSKHRWYETSVVVYKFNDEYFGIRYVTQCYSEQSDVKDIYHTIKAFPMKIIQTISYETENNKL